jgi:hypothetical protein
MPNDELATFSSRVIFVIKNTCKWILKDGAGLVEADTVFLEV